MTQKGAILEIMPVSISQEEFEGTKEVIRISGRVDSSCSTSGSSHVTLDIRSMISHEIGQDREVLPTSGTYPWSFLTQIFHNC
jgi:hypothetical protein